MNGQPYPSFTSNSNVLWLSLESHSGIIAIQSQLLGLAEDYSLLCSLPEQTDVSQLTPDNICKGRTFLDGETYQFETTIQEILSSPYALRLKAPSKITKEIHRTFPRLPVELSGTVRPISDNGNVLAVLPVTLHDLCPTGCQLRVPASTWPDRSIRQIFLTCQLPETNHRSKFLGKIEWMDSHPEMHLGIKFHFSDTIQGTHRDLNNWFSSQQAQLVNIVA